MATTTAVILSVRDMFSLHRLQSMTQLLASQTNLMHTIEEYEPVGPQAVPLVSKLRVGDIMWQTNAARLRQIKYAFGWQVGWPQSRARQN